MNNRRRNIIDSDDDDDDDDNESNIRIDKMKNKDTDAQTMIIDKENQWLDCRDIKTMTAQERYK